MEILIARLARALIWMLSLLPISWARALGDCVGWFVKIVGGRLVETTRDNLSRCFPHLGHVEIEWAVRHSLQHTGALAMEAGMLWCWSERKWKRLVVQETGIDLIEKAVDAGRGVLVLVPHFGNWEFLSLYLGRFKYVCLYERPSLEALEAPMVAARQRTGGRLEPIGRKGIRELTRTLREGGVSILLPDQVPDSDSGVTAEFFGQPALTMTLAHRLAAREHPVVLMAGAQRVHGGFHIFIEPVGEEFETDEPGSAVTAMNKAVERVVLRDPAQYQWEYKRFKTPRPGKRREI